MSEIRKGDRVKGTLTGNRGTAEIVNGPDEVYVVWDHNPDALPVKVDTKLVVRDEDPPTPKFEVGDTVISTYTRRRGVVKACSYEAGIGNKNWRYTFTVAGSPYVNEIGMDTTIPEVNLVLVSRKPQPSLLDKYLAAVEAYVVADRASYKASQEWTATQAAEREAKEAYQQAAHAATLAYRAVEEAQRAHLNSERDK